PCMRCTFVAMRRNPFTSMHAAVVLLSIGVGLSQCSEYNKVLKSGDLQEKLDFAQASLDSGNCFRALPLYDELMQLSRGTERAPDIHWNRALTHDCVNDFYLSKYYFQTFAKTYPNDARVEAALFRAALCSFYLSPLASLDQTDTRTAIDELQLFMDRYPSSSLRDSSQSMVDGLRNKLETKAFENAKIYHTTGNYKSATVAMENAMTDFPGSPYQETLQFLIIDSHFQYAKLSTARRKLERYNDAIQAFHTFASRFPESTYLPEAQGLFDQSVKAVTDLNLEDTNSSANR
ncbi:outer membrane protein assembly factor BamD, partial [Flavobacteriales bacterium]|nr:outer membrane protein assembly factor BamD [Flavobacteriales bacterium]